MDLAFLYRFAFISLDDRDHFSERGSTLMEVLDSLPEGIEGGRHACNSEVDSGWAFEVTKGLYRSMRSCKF